MSRFVTQEVHATGSGALARALLPLGIAAALIAAPAQAASPAAASTAGQVAPEVVVGPVPLPTPRVPGYAYPESQDTLLRHVNQGDRAWIATHAWGLWVALTTRVLPDLSVYETWQSPYDGQVLSSGLDSGGRTQFVGPGGESTLLHRAQRPHQFHGRRFVAQTEATPIPSTSDQVLVTVNWSPQMARQVVQNNWLSSATLDKLLAAGQQGITLNNYSVSLKPTYLWMGAPLLAQGRYYRLTTWPGPPSPAAPFPSSRWGQCVWVDTQDPGTGTGTGGTDTACSPDGSSRTPASTYGLGSFIHFKLTAQEAKQWAEEGINVQIGKVTYQPKAGEVVILAAMHVGTREMTEWTWQSYWWQPDPTKPLRPATPADVAARPAQLRGAPAHYAMCAAYQMVTPNQPITGGRGTMPYLCYNPYLEAPFSPSDLPDSRPWTYQGKLYNLNVGVQTNCMDCHIQATYAKGNGKPLPYTADRYIDLNSPAFKGYLKLDFSWSIQGNVKVSPAQAPSSSGGQGQH